MKKITKLICMAFIAALSVVSLHAQDVELGKTLTSKEASFAEVAQSRILGQPNVFDEPWEFIGEHNSKAILPLGDKETFNATTFPPTGWSRIHSGSASGNWARSTTAPLWDNGYAYRADVNGTNQYSFLISPLITLPATGVYQVQFMSYIGYPTYYAYSSVFVSTTVNDNPNAFEWVYDIDGDDVINAWRQISVNLVAYAGQDIYIAFVYEGNYDHNWRVDDVEIVELPANDLVLNAAYPYTQVPVSQPLQTIHSGKITNTGAQPQTNIVFTTAFNDVTIATSPAHASLAPGANVTLSATSSALPIPLGNNTFTYTATQSETDENPENNTRTDVLVGTQTSYAVDDDNVTWNIGNSSPISLGNIFTITNPVELNRVMLRFAASTPTSFSVSLYAMNGNVPAATAIFTQTATKPTTAGWVTVNVPTTTLEPGNYFVCANQLTNTSFALNADGNPNRLGYALIGTSFVDINTGYAAVIGAPFIRLLVDLPTNDLQIAASNPLLPYTKVPASQAPSNMYGPMAFPATLTAQAFNAGLSAQTNVVFSASFNGVTVGTSTPIATLAPNATSAMNITTPAGQYYPSAQGSYDFVYSVAQDEAEVNPADNSTTFTLEIGNKYQLDDISVINNGVGSNGGTLSAGNIFNIYHPTLLTHVELGINVGGQPYTLSLYRLNGTIINGAAIFTTTSATTVSGFTTVSVPETELTPGDYYLCINQTGTVNISLAYDERANARRIYSKTLTAGAGTALDTQAGFGAAAIRMIVEDTDIPTHVTISTDVTPAGSGTVTGAGTYAIGATVTLEATPEAGNVFVRWDDGETTNPRTFIAYINAAYTAIFRDESCEDFIVGAETTSGYNMPISTSNSYSYVQHLYEAAEIAHLEPGLINAISFQYILATPNAKDPITIYLANTEKTTFASTSDWVPLADLQQVFTGAVNFNNNSSWVTITFDEPFVYTGCNLVVAVLNNTGSNSTGTSATFRYTASTPSSNYKTLYYQNNNPTGGSINLTNSFTGTRSVNRSNTMFEICAGQPEIIDLQASTINGAYKVVPGETYNYTIAVKNNGTVVAEDFIVKVADEDGVVLGQVTVTDPLGLCNPVDVVIPVTIPVETSYAYIINLKGVVELAGDEVAANNETSLYKVNVIDELLVNVTIGSSTTTNTNIPFQFNSSSSIAQSIYLDSEINIATGNKIYALSYNYQTTSGAALPEKPLKVYLAHTELTAVSTWIPLANFTQVFEGVAIVQNTPSPNVYELIFVLDQPFTYEGGNLCVMTEHPMFAPAVSNIVAQVFTATPNNRSRYYGNNTTEFNWTQAGTALNTVPVIHFYRAPEYTLDATYNVAEATAVMTPDPVVHGHDATLTFGVIDNCYQITDVIIGGTSYGAITSYTLTNVVATPVVEVVTGPHEYSIVATAGANGSITPLGTTTLCYLESQAYVMTSDQGYIISELLIDGVSTPLPSNNIYTFSLIDANHTIEVIFEPCPTYDVTYTIVGGGALVYDNTNYTDPSGAIMICQESNPEFDFVPNVGWEIQAVYIDGTLNMLATAGHFMFVNLSQDHDIQVIFKLIDYTITATSGPYGTIAPAGNVLVPYGTNQQFDFVPVTGYVVDQVYIDNVADPAAAAAGYYEFANVMENHTIHVTYKKSTIIIHLSWGEGGTLMPDGGTYVPTGTYSGDVYVLYNHSEFVTINIIPDEGYKISTVTVNGVPFPTLVDSYTFLYTTAESWLDVIFVKETYHITSKVYGNGTINPLGTVSVAHGANKTYYFSALPGHRIANVFIDGVDNEDAIINGTHTFENVTENHTIDVVAVPLTYTITATAGEGGFITPDGEVIVSYGDFQYFTFEAASGYEIDKVLVDGIANTEALQNGGYAFLNIDADHTISIECKVLRFRVESAAGPNGSIEPAGIVELNYGEDVTYTIAPEEGYKISYVLVNGINMGEIETYTFAAIDADGTIQVFFDIEEEGEGGEGGGGLGIDNSTLDISIYSNTHIVYIVNQNHLPIDNVVIFDMYGRLVWQGKPQGNQIPLNVANGIYIVRVISNENFTTKKVNIQR